MLTESAELRTRQDEANAQITIAGSLGRALAETMRRQSKRRSGDAISWADQADGLAGATDVVVVADMPDRADPPLLAGGPAEYGDRLATLLREATAAGDGLVVWLTVPHQAYGDDGPWTERSVRALNKRMKPICAEHGVHLVALAAKLERWGADDHLTRDPKPTLNRHGRSAMATAIGKIVQQWRVRAGLRAEPCPRLDPGKFADLAPLLRESPVDADRLIIDRMEVRDAPFVPGADAEFTLDRRLRMGYWDEIQLDDPIPWTMRGPDRSWESCFLALDFVPALLRNFEAGGGPEHLDRALDIILSWRDANPASAPIAPRSWHEGTTTKRLNTLALTARSLLRALQAPDGRALYAGLGRPGRLVELLALLEQHVTFLLDPNLYIRQGNHGLRQDTFILSAAATFPDFADRARWLDEVSRRLERDQLEGGVSPDGVWLEHSPGYHHQVVARFWKILQLLEFTGRTELSERLRDALDRMLHFAAYGLQPDGRQPPIGDTQPDRVRRPREAAFYEQLPIGPQALYSETQGRSGVTPVHRDAFYPDGGWAILRDAWLDADRFDQTVYVNFHANLHSAKHKHADDLSFLLYGKGRDWIMDSGRLNNELDDPMKDHFRLDAAAHNTYTVDGRSYGFQRKSVRQVGLRQWNSVDEGAFVVGINRLYDAATVVRTLVFLRAEPMILLIDELVSRRGARDWTAHLHLAPDLEVTEHGAACSARCPSSGWILDVATSTAALDRSEIVRGRAEPLLGWLTAGWNEAVEAPVVVHHRRGDAVAAVTGLRLRRAAASPLESVTLERGRRRTYRVEVVDGDRRRHLLVRTGRRPELRWS